MSASGAYNRIKDCATRNQDESIKEQATQGARFFDIDTRMFGNKVDTCHGVAHEVEVKQVTNMFRNFFKCFGVTAHTPVFGLMVMYVLGLKAWVDSLLVCFLTCMQWIPQIHLWCDTY